MPNSDAKEAVDFVFDVLSGHIPFWPQLPKRSFAENMYAQFCQNLPGFKMDEASKSVWVDTSSGSYLSELEECFNRTQLLDSDYFSIGEEFAEGLHIFSQRLAGLNWQGWVKAQIIGPISLGLTLLDEKKNPIIFNAELSDLLPAFLALKLSWLIRQLKVHAKTKVIIFIDEPYLVAVGTSSCSIPREEIVIKINRLIETIHAGGALAGIHCCGNTDWDMVLATDIDIVNFDAFGYMDKLLIYDNALSSFLKRGGMPAIGIVPTDENSLASAGTKDLFEMIKKKPTLLKNGALITTSCGCSGLSVDSTRKAHAMCVELAERLSAEF